MIDNTALYLVYLRPTLVLVIRLLVAKALFWLGVITFQIGIFLLVFQILTYRPFEAWIRFYRKILIL